MNRIAGSYIVSCPLIEERFPEHDGKLLMEIRSIKLGSRKDCVFEGDLHLGIMSGTVALGLNTNYLASYAARETMENFTSCTGSIPDEIRRLDHEAKRAEADTTPFELDLLKPAELPFQFRFIDEAERILPAGTVFSERGVVDFDDLTCLYFRGKIRLPMVQAEEVRFGGYKIHEQCTKSKAAFKPWSSYPAFCVRFGDAWNDR
jgi:hypothetical protein